MDTLERTYYFIIRTSKRIWVLLCLIFAAIGVVWGFAELIPALPSIATSLGITGIYFEIARWTLLGIVILVFAYYAIEIEELEHKSIRDGIKSQKNTKMRKVNPKFAHMYKADGRFDFDKITGMHEAVRKVYEDAGISVDNGNETTEKK